MRVFFKVATTFPRWRMAGNGAQEVDIRTSDICFEEQLRLTEQKGVLTDQKQIGPSYHPDLVVVRLQN